MVPVDVVLVVVTTLVPPATYFDSRQSTVTDSLGLEVLPVKLGTLPNRLTVHPAGCFGTNASAIACGKS